MCLFGARKSNYSMDIRTRKVVRRYFFNDVDNCRRNRAPDHGDYNVRLVRPRHSPKVTTPKHHVAEPRGLSRSTVPSYTSARPIVSPVRSHSYGATFPFNRRNSYPKEETRTCVTREERTSSSFVVDFPDEIEERTPRFVTRSPLRSNSVSPKTLSYAGLENEAPEDSLSVSLRISRSRQPSRESRPPRERSPVTEKEPTRGIPFRPVEVHNGLPPSRDHFRIRDIEHRQVHFAEEIECEKSTNRTRHRRPFNRGSLLAENSFAYCDAWESGYHDSSGYPPYTEARSPGFERTRYSRRLYPRFKAGEALPQIIQEGRRQMSKSGERLFEEARQRRDQDNFYQDLEDRPGWRPWNFRVAHHQGSYPEYDRNIYGRNTGRYRGHWR